MIVPGKKRKRHQPLTKHRRLRMTSGKPAKVTAAAMRPSKQVNNFYQKISGSRQVLQRVWWHSAWGRQMSISGCKIPSQIGQILKGNAAHRIFLIRRKLRDLSRQLSLSFQSCEGFAIEITKFISH